MLFLIVLFCFSFYQTSSQSHEKKNGSAVLDNFPLIDGHNDLPHNLFLKLNNQIANFSFDKNLTNDAIFGVAACKTCHSDIPRLRQGKIGAQFWVAYVDCLKDTNFVVRTIEQIDVIKRLVRKNDRDMKLVTNSKGILEAFKEKKIGSLIGVEGGHSIANNMAVLRQFYDLGVRYLTLTHICNLQWADASLVDREWGNFNVNLTDFGKKIVLEMNRLGMMIDLAHVSHNVMVEALLITKAPVIYSHSSAFGVKNHHRNVQDNVLELTKINKGVIMVNFYSAFIAEVDKANINQVVDHINYIVDKIGHDYIGIGSDFDGVNSVPKDLDDVSKYPKLFDLLREKNETRWNDINLEKLAGRNLIRVFEEVEAVRDSLLNEEPDESRFI